VAGSAQPSWDATDAPSASTSAVARHPYHGTAGTPGNIAPAGRSIRAKPPPPMAPSPWIQTITGLGSAGVADRGAVTFRNRQSSSRLATSA
jgi:hypothetical protein